MSVRMLGLACATIAVVFEALGQIALKKAANRSVITTASGWRIPVSIVAQQPLLIGMGLSCYLMTCILWTLALSFLPVSIVHPMGSIDLIVMLVLSRFILHEQITVRRMIGVGIILAGVILVGTN